MCAAVARVTIDASPLRTKESFMLELRRIRSQAESSDLAREREHHFIDSGTAAVQVPPAAKNTYHKNLGKSRLNSLEANPNGDELEAAVPRFFQGILRRRDVFSTKFAKNDDILNEIHMQMNTLMLMCWTVPRYNMQLCLLIEHGGMSSKVGHSDQDLVARSLLLARERGVGSRGREDADRKYDPSSLLRDSWVAAGLGHGSSQERDQAYMKMTQNGQKEILEVSS
ncbi:uncharacterized protein F5891DRAFT_984467 [Suillus fuscotomentosus]|uniref:Uncharacterized protein n=1 Tax=Suillus fuscotomentosus TaxID=1912939 RepID=A0AAD4DWX4_9AGAM|nr:uncharacterized protein F5891DRAFT_984467 [Suillus fuscotomentosus]KAG1895142.1 hypothetical protein F5891DRAFT_984467 [Suillus fuscotomentosus]